MKRSIGLAAVGIVSIALAGGCSSSDDSTASSPSSTSASAAASTSATPPATGDITVFAAASLKKTFTDIGKQVETENPGSKITFSFAGSSDLVAQLIQGAPADVLATADLATMTKAIGGGVVEGSPDIFATNTLTIVVPPGNPKGIKSFADLAKNDAKVVVCAPQVPCGAATKKVEDATHTDVHPVSEEASVTDVLNKVTAGEADAGVVYVTDAAGAGDKVQKVDFPESSGAVNTYPIAPVKGTKNPALVKKFIDYLDGPQGEQVLTKAGFHTP